MIDKNARKGPPEQLSAAYKRAKYHVGCILFTLAIALLHACAKTDPYPGRSYYYPVEELLEGKVYVYENLLDSSAPGQIWYLRSLQTPDSLLLTSTLYNTALEPVQFVKERIVTQGALMRTLLLYQPTDSVSVTREAEVLQPALFAFGPADREEMLINSLYLPWKDDGQAGGSSYTLTRNRRFNRDTSIVFQGAELPAQIWKVKELIEFDSAGVLSIEAQQTEVYAKTLGLVYRERRFANGSGEAYGLAYITTMDSLASAFAQIRGRTEQEQ